MASSVFPPLPPKVTWVGWVSADCHLTRVEKEFSCFLKDHLRPRVLQERFLTLFFHCPKLPATAQKLLAQLPVGHLESCLKQGLQMLQETWRVRAGERMQKPRFSLARTEDPHWLPREGRWLAAFPLTTLLPNASRMWSLKESKKSWLQEGS